MREKGSQNQDEEPERMSRLAVIGAGYAGLVTSATLAHLGHDVCCADIVPEKVAMLSRGEIPIVELRRSSRSSRMSAVERPAGSWRTAKGATWISR
jgi:UDPglucose 6-dehydrogenase